MVVRDSGGSYGAALQKAIYTPFTQETGITVKVLNLDDAPLLAQIKQGRPQCDLINNSMMSHLKYVAQDALETLDLDRVKSVKSAKIPESPDHRARHRQQLLRPVHRRTARTPSAARSRSRGRTSGTPRRSRVAARWSARTVTCRSWSSRCWPTACRMDKLYPLDVDRAFKVLTRLRADIKKFWDSGPLPGVLLSRQEVDDVHRLGRPARRPAEAGRPGRRRQLERHAPPVLRAMPSPRARPTRTTPTS